MIQMPFTMDVAEWTQVLEQEYLRAFVPAGGSAFKLIVPSSADQVATLLSLLHEVTSRSGLLTFQVSANQTSLQYVDRLFFAVARAIDWEQLATRFLRRVLVESGYVLPHNDITLAALASANERDINLLRVEINRQLEQRIYRDYSLTHEFRLAMIRLCISQLDPGNDALTGAVKEWFRGELRLISSLKNALIFQRITRANGRHLLASLVHWFRVLGEPGTALLLDISALAVASRRQAGPNVFYSIAGIMDVLEVLRQFIDGMEELEGCMILVVTSPTFISDSRRGLACYDALRLRLVDDVHDRRKPNPMAPLMTLQTAG